MAESLPDLFDRLVPEETRSLLTRILGEAFQRRGAGGRHRILAAGAFRGYLTESLLALAGHPRTEAALVVVDEDAERALLFRQGEAVGATSSVLFERLGRILYKSEVVTHADADLLVRLEETQGAREVIGWIPDEVLRWAVARRVREVAAALPYVSRGHFLIVEGEAPPAGLPETSFDPGELGEEARRLYDAWRQGSAGGTEDAGRAPDAPAPLPGPLRPPRTREDEIQDILRRVRRADIRPGGAKPGS